MKTMITKDAALKMGKIGRQYGLTRASNPFSKSEEPNLHGQWLDGFIDVDCLLKHGEPIEFADFNAVVIGALS